MRAPHTAQCHLAFVIKYRPVSPNANAMRFSKPTCNPEPITDSYGVIQAPRHNSLLYMLVPGSTMSNLLGTNKTADEKGTAYFTQSNPSGT
jgi:hypothetical protein